MIQPFWDEDISIQIVECYEQDIVAYKKCRQVSLCEKGKIIGPWIKDEGYKKKAEPGCYMYDDLYDSFLQVRDCFKYKKKKNTSYNG